MSGIARDGVSKIGFSTEFLQQHPEAGLEDVIAAWQKEEGNEGDTISHATYAKAKTAARAFAPEPSAVNGLAGRMNGAGDLNGRHTGADLVGGESTTARPEPSRAPRVDARNTELDLLEGEIDRLMFRVHELGDLGDALPSLRAARRAVVFSRD